MGYGVSRLSMDPLLFAPVPSICAFVAEWASTPTLARSPSLICSNQFRFSSFIRISPARFVILCWLSHPPSLLPRRVDVVDVRLRPSRWDRGM
ncbi:hypothetical protein BDN71DRAFT_1458020, partial [Pleurotus eryngii]